MLRINILNHLLLFFNREKISLQNSSLVVGAIFMGMALMWLGRSAQKHTGLLKRQL